MQIPEEILSRKFGLAIGITLLLYAEKASGNISPVIWAICTTALGIGYCIGQGLAEMHFATVMIPTQKTIKTIIQKKEGGK